CQQEYSWPLTF
nr:immunoglobulin light chain junction region [Macaca mulatta]MOX85258.1 immunoglobulin light chain junction region [Macaca mulatta]